MNFVYDMDHKFEDCLGNIYARIIKASNINIE